jgi:regulator of sigma E protease
MIAILQNAFIYVVPFLLVITAVITIHEFGHFLAGRAFGVAIDRFSIGFGRTIVSWTDRLGTEWRIAWLPIGGYVRYAGDDNVASVPDQSDLETMRAAIVAREGVGAERKYLYFKPLWQRTVIVLAGPFANFVLATALFAVLFGVFGESVTSTRVDSVVPGGAAAKAGFQAGDVILRADEQPLRTFEDLQVYVHYRAGVPIDFTVRRGDRDLRIAVTPAPVAQTDSLGDSEKVGMLGLIARGSRLQHHGPIESIGLGADRTWNVVETTVFFIGRVLTGQANPSQLHSIVGMAHVSGDMTKQVLTESRHAGVSPVTGIALFLLNFAAVISASVGLFNLLPIPVLDGGHLLFYAYELVVRRPLAAKIQAIGYRVGLALLVGLMLFATWNDLQLPRLFHLLGSIS